MGNIEGWGWMVGRVMWDGACRCGIWDMGMGMRYRAD